ncbi:zinc finger protein 385C isoform X2 [Coregonus clupeaformis]|uniref:zinc finger protein 385C isoform X2 n=1 Tax=Coregonus clupeaformis TaxID=59861 RepID=UPI001E1C7ADB|nr:zinc finger protein 385C isoform X2 [Coregonus clupeaformis]
MLGTDDHRDNLKRNGSGMKRPFSPSSVLDMEEDRNGLGVGMGLTLDSEACCDPQEEGVVLGEQPGPGGGALPSSDHSRPKRERKQRSYTLCDVCNIQLNSPAQAQIHYNGKSHQKRLKQISNGKIQHGNTGTSAQGNPLLASLPVPGRPLQPHLDLKHFLPFRLNGSSPLSLFPNFSTMDPVQKAVINHTFGVPQPLKKKQIISCNICHLRFNSTNQAEAHYKGHKHARKLKAMEAQKNRQRRLGEATSTGREKDRERNRERDRERAKSAATVTLPTETLPALMDTGMMEATNLLPADLEPVVNCEAVKLGESPGCSSSVMLTPVSEVSSMELATLSPGPQGEVSPSSQASESGASDTSGPEQGPEAPGTALESGSQPDTSSTEGGEDDKDPKRIKPHLHCPVCKVTVNSTSQLEAHNSGTKHKQMLEGQSVQPRRRGKVVGAGGRSACKSKRLGTKGSVGVPSKNFHCEHMNSRRHKDRLAGKPPKPKFSPHNKSQPTSSLSNVRWAGYAGGAVSAMKKMFSQYNLTSLSTQAKLAFQKQLTKSLTTGFLPSPLTQPTLCTMATNPLALRHPAGTTFFQTPFLSPTLFRPAPGPLRATHPSIIFSPY